jgi:hypothetical protein
VFANLLARKCGRWKRVLTAMRPFPEGSSMVKTCPTNAGPKPPPPLAPPPLPPASPVIRVLRDSEDDDVEAEETGRRGVERARRPGWRMRMRGKGRRRRGSGRGLRRSAAWWWWTGGDWCSSVTDFLRDTLRRPTDFSFVPHAHRPT